MFGHRFPFVLMAAFCGLLFMFMSPVAPTKANQVAEPPEEPAQHQHEHQMNLPSGVSDRCEPKFSYEDGPLAPSHWEGVCNTGHSQSPVDITSTKKIPIPPLEFQYQPAEMDMVNDCNKYLIKVRFPENMWLRVARKPYRLSEIDFHEPGENAVNGKRPPMSLELIHLSPESTFLIIEVPVVVGKENPAIKALWEHIPQPGKEQKAEGVKINAMDLLPTDRGFYTFRGSLTNPFCNEGALWFVMKNPIEMSEAQIAQYKKYYHNTARPLQPLGERPVVESN